MLIGPILKGQTFREEASFFLDSFVLEDWTSSSETSVSNQVTPRNNCPRNRWIDGILKDMEVLKVKNWSA